MNISSISNLASHLSDSAQTKAQPSQDQKALIQAVKTMNAAGILGEDNEFTFIIDRAANVAVVRIVNKETGEVVQQIPTEQVLKMAEESSRR